MRFSHTGAQVLNGSSLKRHIAEQAQTAFSGRALGFEADLDAVANGQAEQPHHVEALAVHRVVDTEDIAHASDLEPDDVLINIAAVGVVRDAVGPLSATSLIP